MTLTATKKPITIECVKWDGTNFDEVKAFCPTAFMDGEILTIPTLEGNHQAILGSYIIKGVKGEFYPCEGNIFLQSYNIVSAEADTMESLEAMHGFDWAIQQLKAGRKVQRKGWNGKGMFLTLQEGSTVHGELMRNAPAKEFYTGKLCNINAHIDMKAADDSYTVGWAPSQPDMMAVDWQIAK